MAEHRGRSRYRRKRTGGRKFLRGISMAIVVIAILVGCVYLLKAERIDVEGASRYTASQVAEACGVRQNDNLLLLNKTAAEQAIVRNLPYVHSATVKRVLPDTLRITLHESPIAGLVYDGTALWVIDAYGKVMDYTPIDQLEGAGPWVEGLTAQEGSAVGRTLIVADSQQEQFQYLQVLLQELERHGMLPQVTGINCATPGTLIFDWGGRFTVLVPSQSDLDYKLRYLESIESQLESTETGRIDLTRDEAHFIPTQIS